MNNSTISILNKYNTTLPPQENLPNKEGNEELLKENLMFQYQEVSICKLYCQVLGKFEIFLMVIAIIATIGSGCSTILRAKLVGDNLNVLVDLGKNQINDVNDANLDKEVNESENTIDTTNKKFTISGAILFVLDFLSIFLWSYINHRLIYKLRINYFSYILRQEQAWFDQNNPYEFTSKVQAQIEGIEEKLGDNPRFIILFSIEVIVGYVVGFIISWKITLVLMACCIPFIIFGYLLTVCGLERQKFYIYKQNEKAGGIAEELLYNIQTVTSFANFDYEINRYENAYNSSHISESNLNQDLVLSIVMFGIFFGFSMALIFSRTLIGTKDQEKIGKIFTLLFSLQESNLSLYYLIPIFISLKESCILASDYFYLYERVPQIYVSVKNLKPERELIKGNIEFKNVNFSYSNDINQNKKVILDGLNLSIEAGKKVAIVGESGSGKSTCASLFERLYEPNEGEIFLDGIDIKEYNLEYLRDLIGYVKQEHFLFNKSIKQNIVLDRENKIMQYGDLDAILEKSVTDAYIKDFIAKKVDKYEYNVGIQGNKLLPGQKQRVSIARAIYGQPKIMIFDEATSALDHESEQHIIETINAINQQNITVIIIGYNYNILKNVDLIYVLKDGKVIEKGNHEQLMAQKGYYTGLIKNESQKKYMESENNNEKKRKMTLRKCTRNYTNLYGKTLMYKLEGEEEVKYNICKLFGIVCDQKLNFIIGTVAGLLFGALIPFRYLLLGKLSTVYAKNDNSSIKKGVLKWALLFLLVVFIWVVCDFFKNRGLNELSYNLTAKTRRNLFQKYLELHMGFYDFESNNPAGLLSLLSVEAHELGLFYKTTYSSIITTLGVMITSVIIGLSYSWIMTLLIFCFFPIKLAFTFCAGKSKSDEKKKSKEIMIEASSYFSNCVTNTNTIYSYNFQQGAVDIYKSMLDRESKGFIKNNLLSSLFTSASYFLSFASNSVAYKAGLKLIKNKNMKFDNIIKVRDTIMSYMDGMYFRMQGNWDFSKVKIAYKCIYSILNTPSEINALEYANKDKIPVNELKGKIEFKDVTFSYPTKPNLKVLQNLSFVIPPGKRVAIIGSSESGKSTIIKLINRFYEVYKGEILIDDINIKEYNLYELRKRIGYMSDEPVLFRRSIYENILYGKLDSSKEEVFDMAHKASISDFLLDKANIDDNLTSQGQKQRINIARIFLKNPDIFLLENITSSLDKDNEKMVQNSITQFQQGKTLIFVTHSLNIITNYDIILFMDKGKLVEQGTHNQLLQLKGKYYNLYNIYY